MRNSRSIWPVPARISPLASSTRSMSSACTNSATSLTESSRFCGARPRISNMDCDQKIAPRDRSHSHRPEWPRRSAMWNARLRLRIDEVRLLGARRLRVKAKPRMTSTMLVATNTVASRDTVAAIPRTRRRSAAATAIEPAPSRLWWTVAITSSPEVSVERHHAGAALRASSAAGSARASRRDSGRRARLAAAPSATTGPAGR